MLQKNTCACLRLSITRFALKLIWHHLWASCHSHDFLDICVTKNKLHRDRQTNRQNQSQNEICIEWYKSDKTNGNSTIRETSFFIS